MTRLALLLSLCVAIAVGACSSDAVPPPPKVPAGSLTPLSVPDAGVDTVTARERALPALYAAALSSAAGGGPPFAGLVPLLDADLAEFWSPLVATTHEPEGIVAAHREIFGAFEDRRFALTRVWRTPSTQAVEWIMTGKHAHEWLDVPATSEAVAFRGLTLLWTKDDGTLVDVHVYFDAGQVRAKLAGAPKEVAFLPAPTPPDDGVRVFEASATGSTERANMAVVRGWLDSLERNDEAAYVGALRDDVEIATAESPQPAKGKEAARRYLRAVRKAIGQVDTTINGAWAVSDFVIVEYDIDGEQLGKFAWIPLLSGVPARTTRLAHFDLVDVCEVQDGKIARVWRYEDPMQVAREKLVARATPAVTDAGGATPPRSATHD